ncbi:MAG: lytic transglycosylase domain-containing protein [Saprospiraceae bacterium]|jgi:membrane-bound lytic murein transglycosylase D|nr:lytic transglycosylase domain-containing protein [Saprospiraceae bacterium]
MKRIPCTLAAAWLALGQVQAAVTTSEGIPLFLSANELGSLPDEAEIKFRISMMRSPITTGYDADVRAYLNRYLSYGIRDTEGILGRAMVYLPVIEHYLEMNGLPTQLKYLPIVESALVPHTSSTQGAAGLWQLVPETARSLGLVVNSILDERKDPNRATEAAAKYLKRLHKKYGNWNLALVAYNCGPGRLNKAIEKAGCKNYDEIKHHLPKETQTYLARYLAAAYVATYFHHHDLAPALPDPTLLNAMAARVYGTISLQKISKITGLSLSTLRYLNPGYLADKLPAKLEGTFLTLPKSAWVPYLEALNRTALRP